MLAGPLRRANAQERVRRVAVLNGVAQYAEAEALVASFGIRSPTSDGGWHNLELEVRWSAASADSTRRAARELLGWKPDVTWRGTPFPSKSCWS